MAMFRSLGTRFGGGMSSRAQQLGGHVVCDCIGEVEDDESLARDYSLGLN
jgi:hypothetical protein